MIKSWSPSRLATYEQCHRLAKYNYVDKLCPSCFNGALAGFDPQVCSNCNQSPVQAPPLVRGTEVHRQAEDYIKCRLSNIPQAFSHPEIKLLIKELRDGFKNKHVMVETDIVLDYQYQPISKFHKEAFARFKLDVLQIVSGSLYRVIDWKTGNVDRDGKIKPDEKYEQQLEAYSIAVLSAFPTVEQVDSWLVFVDADDNENPIVRAKEGYVTRKQLRSLRLKWKKRIDRMFKDTEFVPMPSDKCRWCSFRKAVGGPCEY